MGSSVDVHREGKRNDDTPAPDEAGNRRRRRPPALSATVEWPGIAGDCHLPAVHSRVRH